MARTMIEGDKGSLLPPFLSGDPHWESDGAQTMIEGGKGSLLLSSVALYF